MKKFIRSLFFASMLVLLIGCAGKHSPLAIRQMSDLEYGKKLFNEGYYKSAMQELIPVAYSGNAEAQYGIGYMYYYGYGVTQDTDVGYLWIKLAANQGYKPAKDALAMIKAENQFRKPLHYRDKSRN